MLISVTREWRYCGLVCKFFLINNITLTRLHVLYFKKVNFVIIITPLLRALHWLPVAYRIVFKILLLTFKAIHKLAPTYISELVSPKDTGDRYYLRSNNGKLLNIPPCKSLSTLGDRSFYMASPKLWNDLPLFIRNISSVNAFKKALKTHLFQKAFPS